MLMASVRQGVARQAKRPRGAAVNPEVVATSPGRACHSLLNEGLHKALCAHQGKRGVDVL